MLKDWEADEELGEHRAAQKPPLGKHKEPLGPGSGAAAPALGKPQRPRFHPSSRRRSRPGGRTADKSPTRFPSCAKKAASTFVLGKGLRRF